MSFMNFKKRYNYDKDLIVEYENNDLKITKNNKVTNIANVKGNVADDYGDVVFMKDDKIMRYEFKTDEIKEDTIGINNIIRKNNLTDLELLRSNKYFGYLLKSKNDSYFVIPDDNSVIKIQGEIVGGTDDTFVTKKDNKLYLNTIDHDDYSKNIDLEEKYPDLKFKDGAFDEMTALNYR